MSDNSSELDVYDIQEILRALETMADTSHKGKSGVYKQLAEKWGCIMEGIGVTRYGSNDQKFVIVREDQVKDKNVRQL